jgi:hypothetical protein
MRTVKYRILNVLHCLFSSTSYQIMSISRYLTHQTGHLCFFENRIVRRVSIHFESISAEHHMNLHRVLHITEGSTTQLHILTTVQSAVWYYVTCCTWGCQVSRFCWELSWGPWLRQIRIRSTWGCSRSSPAWDRDKHCVVQLGFARL